MAEGGKRGGGGAWTSWTRQWNVHCPRLRGRGGGQGCIGREGASEAAPQAVTQAVAKAVGGGYCRLQMPLRLALGVRGTVAGHRLGALEGKQVSKRSTHARPGSVCSNVRQFSMFTGMMHVCYHTIVCTCLRLYFVNTPVFLCYKTGKGALLLPCCIPVALEGGGESPPHSNASPVPMHPRGGGGSVPDPDPWDMSGGCADVVGFRQKIRAFGGIWKCHGSVDACR